MRPPAAVRCSAWILIMSPFGMGWACPNGIWARDRGRCPSVGFSGSRNSQPRCGLRPGPISKEDMMRFYQQQHRFYCGVDLHARTMYLCIVDQAGAILLHKNLAADPNAFRAAIA